MPRVTDLLRSRQARRVRAGRRRGWTMAGLAAAGAASVVAGLAAMAGAALLGDLQQGLPPVTQIESVFDPTAGGAPRSTLWLDRSGSVLLYEAASPAAAERRGVSLDPASPDAAPPALVQATVAFVDPGFWAHRGYEAGWLWRSLWAGLTGQPVPEGDTITMRLVRNTLAPPGDASLSPLVRGLREALLASELTRSYDRETILAWYLNAASYGESAYGVDAAALVYFGKHAAALDLGESALLAGLPLDPRADPFTAPQRAKAQQAAVLEAMLRLGLVPVETAQTALSEPLALADPPPEPAMRAPAFTRAAMQQLQDRFGPELLQRSGLRILTTIDIDLQLQAECVARTQLGRLSGSEPGAVVSAADGTPCVAAGLLPPLRPGDARLDHVVGGAGVVVLDPQTGVVLARIEVGSDGASADTTRLPGPALYPFIYLAGFARGTTPASMTLDIPTVFPEADGGPGYAPADDDGIFYGPVRARTALANLYPVAAARAAAQVGVGDVLRTARQMGLTSLPEPSGQPGLRMLLEDSRVGMLDLGAALGVIADGGVMVGATAAEEALAPSMLLRITNDAGDLLYAYTPETRAVLSAPLAYLMTDVLSDEAARWPSLGQPNPLEVGRPAGALSGVTLDDSGAWAIGFGPSRVLVVWMGNDSGAAMQGVTAANGPAAVWHALLRYATRDLPAQGWSMPAGVSRVEVCDPSGLLPTSYCPRTVSEVFLQGTEPIHVDSLYRPLQVNRETGKLATLYTPLDLVEERVYLMVPAEAEAWAAQAGLERPPTEYDTLYEPAVDPRVRIASPAAFAVMRGQVEVRGDARRAGFAYYRLQYGEGLNPDRWVQIGQDQHRAVRDGRLGLWDTAGLHGLYTLQLLVVEGEGRVATAALQVTVDNAPPTLRLVLPAEGQSFSRVQDQAAILQVEAGDDLALAQVAFYLDGVRVGEVSAPPYSLRWPLGRAGEHMVYARALDSAGNAAESERVTFRIEP